MTTPDTIIVPDTLYVGSPEALQAEVGLLECYQGKYIVFPTGEASWVAIPCDSKKEVKAVVAELRRAYGTRIPVCFV